MSRFNFTNITLESPADITDVMDNFNKIEAEGALKIELEEKQDKYLVVTDANATYTIAQLLGGQIYNLTNSSLTTLTILSATQDVENESTIYFNSGSPGTSLTIPNSWTCIGDVPTLTVGASTSTGTAVANTKYIISILNNIAIFKEVL